MMDLREIVSHVLVTKLGFGLVIVFINCLRIVTTINYNTVHDFDTKNHSTLISSVHLHQSSWVYNMGAITVLLNYTLPIPLHCNTHRVFQSHVKSSLAVLLSSSELN
jgi:hypothetical protein